MFKNVNRAKFAFIATLIFGGISVLFITKAGLYYLDIVDHFIVQYAVITIVLLESIVFGWIARKQIINFVNQNSSLNIGRLWTLLTAVVIPISLIALLITNVIAEFKPHMRATPYQQSFG